jgi:hypothetical protein
VLIFLSGPMSNMPGYNFPAFHDAARELTRRGYSVLDPSSLGRREDWQWRDYMRETLRMLLDADGVGFLPGWHDSRGALLEMSVAADLGIPRKYYKDWI